jgi:hypothetical protein
MTSMMQKYIVCTCGEDAVCRTLDKELHNGLANLPPLPFGKEVGTNASCVGHIHDTNAAHAPGFAMFMTHK